MTINLMRVTSGVITSKLIKETVVFFLLLTTINAYPQALSKKDSTKRKQPTVSRLTTLPRNKEKKIGNDTIKAKAQNNNINIIIPKKEESVDYFKYIFPIVTLLLGIGINKLLDFLSDKKDINKTGERWIAELRCLEIPIQNQINSLTRLLDEQREDAFNMPQLDIQTLLNADIFKSLDKTELLKYVEKNSKVKYEDAVLASNRVHGYISSLTHNFDLLSIKYDEYSKAVSDHTTTISRNLQSLMKAFGNYAVTLERELGNTSAVENDPRYKHIADLFDQHIIPYMEDGNYDVFFLRREFFKPLMGMLVDMRQDERTSHMVDNVSNCLIEIQGIKMERSYFTENLETLIQRFNNELVELPQIVAGIRRE